MKTKFKDKQKTDLKTVWVIDHQFNRSSKHNTLAANKQKHPLY